MGTSTVNRIHKRLQDLADPKSAAGMRKYFKTGPGEYGEGDVFLGIKVPAQRAVAREAVDLPTDQVPKLLASAVHEHRSVGLMIWVIQFQQGNPARQKQIYRLYLANTARINNWDLVDLSCPTILGDWLADRSHSPLMKLAKSPSLWERRMAIVSTFAFIRRGQFETTLKLARELMADKHDLTHKACGWMLREVYKRNSGIALGFINEHIRRLPRTILRYAIERCEPRRRRALLTIR